MDGTHRQDRTTVAEVAAALPWLIPPADALERLAAEPTPISELAFDPGLVLLALRFVRPSPSPDTFSFRSLRDSVVAEAAARLLELPAQHWPDPARPAVQSLIQRSRRNAVLARSYAERTGLCRPDSAAAIGLLSNLGEWAVAAVSPDAPASDCGAIVRRLGTRWRLPDWVAATLANRHLPVSDAVRLGADFELSRMLREIESEAAIPPTGAIAVVGEDPRSIRLLPQLLRSAARARRAGNDFRLRTAEAEVDRLRELLVEIRDDFEIAVRDTKLAGLAELSAGAGHEINNPLAIISGHAQRLRKSDPDPERQKALDAILRQSARISEIVRELMQFARPAAPNRTAVDTNEVVAELIEELEEQAEERGIAVVHRGLESGYVDCDSMQLRKMLRNLIRNAIEASPDGGTVRIESTADAEAVRIAVEDDGPGPKDEAIPHLFDPFYSGRPAGRGRGLGLATAWRLASINGADLRFQRGPSGPTRFVIEFPAPQLIPSLLRIPA